MDATQFLTALLAIVVIDIVLAGDNAIVIALAARALPAHLQKRAIVWGAFGAVAVRGLMTVIVVWLLQIPGLLMAGGVLLLWIAHRLLRPDTGTHDAHGKPATSFWAAMRTIVVADAVMGLDNVLAVAGAAHGSYALVVTGLLISVPIVMWGSTLVLKVVERYPGVVYLGAGVLVWTAVKMVLSEPLIAPWLQATPVAAKLAYLAIPLLLWLGFVSQHRHFESRIRARLAEFAAPGSPALGSEPEGDDAMMKILVPVDGSKNALLAVRQAIAEHRQHERELHLLNVQPHLSRHVARFLSSGDRGEWHRAQAHAAMADAEALLQQSGVPYQLHWVIGDRAAQICRFAADLGAHHIVMATARKNSLTRMLQDSITNQVLQDTPVPVQVVAGDAVSKWERWGLPAGLIGAGGLLLLAID